jgi:hypothetical protein
MILNFLIIIHLKKMKIRGVVLYYFFLPSFYCVETYICSFFYRVGINVRIFCTYYSRVGIYIRPFIIMMRIGWALLYNFNFRIAWVP